jgi:DNA/RNA endonuclease G (NUC1)
MRISKSRALRTLAGALAAVLASCTPISEIPTAAVQRPLADGVAVGSIPDIVISQVYGGGGNAGATFRNDFIELFNPGTSPVNVAGWSVQYSSSAGSSWAVTPLSGTIDPGHYYLVQEAPGAGGTVDLPTPDATNATAMAAGAGKVWLSRSITALTGTCPVGGSVVDGVSYGTAATNCGFKTTATLTNPTAALRKDSGCQYTNDLSMDFSTGTPTPRNSSTAPHACPVAVPSGPLDHVLIAGPNIVSAGGNVQFTATPQDANNVTVTGATVTWMSSDATIASVDATGKVTGVASSANAVTITVTAVSNNITVTNSAQITVGDAQIGYVDISASSASFPPGFQAQLFPTARVSSGGTIVAATFVFEALDPTVATVAVIANTGLVTSVSASATKPRFRVTATPIAGGTPYQFITSPIIVETPAPAPTSIYATNDEFGDPTAAGANANDLLIVRPEYTLSYNESRGTPNWVSYELDARQIVAGQDRCNCFTADPMLPTAKQIFTSDYTNGGFDRGHMTRSADRTAGNVDNASTFYLTNVVPQQADLNQGVWAQFENALADSAKAGRAVYIVTGPIYSRALTYLKNEGKVAIPDSTWKIAVIGPDPSGVPFTRSDVQTTSDLANITVLAVNMPNVPGVRNDPFSKYLTTVAKIETSTGFNFLSVLSEPLQCRIEVRNCVPDTKLVSANGTATVGVGESFIVNTSASDADGADGPWKLTVDWGDGTSFLSTLYALPTSARPFARAKVWSAPGTYTVRLKVTDKKGGQGISTLVVTVTP